MSVRFFACSALVLQVLFGLSASVRAQESVYDLPWRVGIGEFDLPHMPATLHLDEDQAAVFSDSALDFERIGTGVFSFRAPAVVVSLNEERQVIDNAYIQFVETGNIGLEDWRKSARPHVLARLFNDTLARGNQTRPEGSKLRFSRWLDVPRLDEETATIYYAFQIQQGSGTYWVNAKALKLTREGLVAITWIGTDAQYHGAEETLARLTRNTQLDDGQAHVDFDPRTDTRASFGVGALLEKLLRGEQIGVKVPNIAVFDQTVERLSTYWWLILLPLTTFWAWRRLRKESAARRAERRLSTFKENWLLVFLIGLVGAAVLGGIGLESRYAKPFPADDEVTQVESIAWQIRDEGKRVYLTLIGYERPFIYRNKLGGKAREIGEAARKSFETGSRVTVEFSFAQMPDDPDQPIPILGFKAGEDAVLTLDQSRKSAERAKTTYFVAGIIALLVCAGLMSGGLVFRAKSNAADRPGWALAANVALVMVLLGGRFGYGEREVWSADRVEVAQKAYEDGRTEAAIEITDTALTWASLSDYQRAEILKIKGDALQDLGAEQNDDDLLLASFDALDEALMTFPDDTDYLRSLGSTLMELGAYPEATEAFKRMEDRGSFYWSYVRRAQVERILGRYESAEALYQLVYEGYDEWYGMPLNYHRAKNFILQGEYSEAVTSIDRGLEHQETYAWAHAYRACANASLGDFEAAEKDAARALEIVREQLLEVPDSKVSQESEQKLLALLATFEAVAGNESGGDTDFCGSLSSSRELKRDRSPKIPDPIERAYLMPIVDAEEGS